MKKHQSTPPTGTPIYLLPYLCHTGSLTQKLTQLKGDEPNVQLLSAGWSLVWYEHKRQWAWVRRVTLGDEVAWVYATTMILAKDLVGASKRLTLTKNSPIGRVLFARQHTLPFCRTFFVAGDGIGRRTHYRWQGIPLTIDEVFLPHFIYNVLKTCCPSQHRLCRR